MKKSQAAMEFIMTYGWAILVVILAVAGLNYFGVLSMAKMVPVSCTFPSSTPCVDVPTIYASDDSIQIALRNNVGANINITAVTLVTVGCTGPVALISVNGNPPPVEVNNDGIIRLNISCPGLEEGRSKTEIFFNYINLDSRQEHTKSGYITGVAS
jgi:hypothetical protein